MGLFTTRRQSLILLFILIPAIVYAAAIKGLEESVDVGYCKQIDFQGGNITLSTTGLNCVLTESGLIVSTSDSNDTEVLFNDGGTNIKGDADFTWNKTTNTLTIGGDDERWTGTTYGEFIDFNDLGDGYIYMGADVVTSAINHVVVVDGTTYAATDTGIEAAITAAGVGGKVFLPEGTYILTGDIDIATNGITLFGVGTGTILTLANATGEHCINIAATDVTIRDLYIDGNSANQSNPYYAITTAFNAHRAKYINVFVEDMYGSGLYINGSDDGEIRNCHVKTIGVANIDDSGYGNGIRIGNDSDNVKIIGNRVETTEGSGIRVEGSSGSEADSFVVSNNVITGVNGDTREGILVEYARYGTITGNTLNGFTDTTDGVNGIRLATNAENCIIDSNNIINVSGTGIELDSGGHLVTNNEITINGTGNDGQGIYITGTDNTVSNNTVFEAYQHGIYVDSNASETIISGNTVKNAQKAGDGSAIRMVAGGGETIENIQIYGNQLFDDQGSPTQQYGIYSSGAGTISDIQIFGNYYSGNQTADVSGIDATNVGTFEMESAFTQNYGDVIFDTTVNGLFYDDSTDRVGIGTSTPSGTLDVADTFTASGSTVTFTGTNNNCIITIDGDGTCDSGTALGVDNSIAVCAVCQSN